MKKRLILASEQDSQRYSLAQSYCGLPHGLDYLSKDQTAKQERGKPRGYDHIHLFVGKGCEHLAQWWGRVANGYRYPIGRVMVIVEDGLHDSKFDH